MAPRGRANTTGDSNGSLVDSSNSSPSSKGRPSESSASSVRSLRQRHSFFGRSNSDAGKARKLRPLHGSTPSQDSTEDQTQSRPRTALSGFSSDQSSTRSVTKPLESIRDSFFGGRRNGPTVLGPAREHADSSTLPAASAVPTWSREHFSNKVEYERHLTKQAISPPFNFMHVTHTEKSKLPALDTVDEKDLPGEFWSVSAYQRPRRHLHGIKAEDLRKKRPQREMSPISPISTNANRPPVSPIVEDAFDDVPPVIPQRSKRMTPLDESMFDGISQTRFESEDNVLSLEPAKQVVKYPKRYSSLNALDELSKAAGEEPGANTFYESSSNASGDPGSRTVSPTMLDDQQDRSKTPASSIDILAGVPNFPLPPLPNKRPSQNQFKKSMASNYAPNISVVIPQPVSPRSKRSSRSLKSSLKSPTFSPHSDSRNSMTFYDDNTWEDDVDFYYEQGAESTCDFNWDVVGAPRKLSAQTNSSQLSIPQSYHAVSPAISNDSTSSFRFKESNTSTETIAERRKSRVAQPPSHHKRGSSVASVGHRGFLAARKSSTDLTALAESATPAPIQMAPNPARVRVLSPVFSVTGADDEPQKSPFTPDALKFPRFDSIITDNLSDPESNRNSGSSKHRKSSSYGSHESTARPPPNVAKETTRWSVASVSSLPDLLHPRRSKTFLSKTIISAPLETLPQSPPIEMDGAEESTIVPRELQSQPVRNSFVMRRPQHAADRGAMPDAGRMVQRRISRPESTQRRSRIIQTPDGLAVPEATKTGPQWI